MSYFKIHRRSTLSNEVDGIWHYLEEEEDNFTPQTITSEECQTLRKVLARNDDMSVLPNTCKLVATAQTKGGFMTNLTTRGSDLGKVSLGECKQLSTSLSTLVGGMTFLPSSCAAMLKRDEAHEKERFELLSRRQIQRVPTYVAQHGYPPTAC